MRILKIVFWILWRIWFYVLMTLTIVVLFPFLLISISSDELYPFFFKLAKIWAKVVLFGTGFYYKVEREQETELGKSYMFSANHTSMTDVMLMLAITKNPFVFVGKKELVKIPLFGFFYKRTCILVDRSSQKSRTEVYRRAQKRLNEGLSICIFPEGKVPEEHILLDEFKDGAFRLAIEHQIPIVPMTFPDNIKRFSYTFFSGSPGIMRAKVHQFIETKGLTSDDKNALKEKTRTIILNQLLEYNK
jgi:1-acyl-sn-glycerol-3-phosphate acyltransferase